VEAAAENNKAKSSIAPFFEMPIIAFNSSGFAYTIFIKSGTLTGP